MRKRSATNFDFDAVFDGEGPKRAPPSKVPGPRDSFFKILQIDEDTPDEEFDDELKKARQRNQEEYNKFDLAPKHVQEAYARLQNPKDRATYRELLRACRQRKTIPFTTKAHAAMHRRNAEWAGFRLYTDPIDNSFEVCWPDEPDPNDVKIPVRPTRPTWFQRAMRWVRDVPLFGGFWADLPPELKRVSAIFRSFVFWCVVGAGYLFANGPVREYLHERDESRRAQEIGQIRNEENDTALKFHEVEAERSAVQAAVFSQLGVNPIDAAQPEWFETLLEKEPTAKEAWDEIQMAVPNEDEMRVKREKLSALESRVNNDPLYAANPQDIAVLNKWLDAHLTLLQHQAANRDLIARYITLSHFEEDRRNSRREKE